MFVNRLAVAMVAIVFALGVNAPYASAATEDAFVCYGSFYAGSEGTVYPQNGSTVDGDTYTSVAHWSHVRAGHDSGCSSFESVGPNWMRASAAAYKDGGYCGGSGWKYNPSTATGHSALYFCSDPAGVQEFYTLSLVSFWSGSSYSNFGTIFSGYITD